MGVAKLKGKLNVEAGDAKLLDPATLMTGNNTETKAANAAQTSICIAIHVSHEACESQDQPHKNTVPRARHERTYSSTRRKQRETRPSNEGQLLTIKNV
jgi:hypothetical protein